MSARFCDDCGMRKAVCRELGGCQHLLAHDRRLRAGIAATDPKRMAEKHAAARAALPTIVREFAAAGGDVPDDLEDKLRASVALNDRKRMAHEDLYEQIEKRREELLERVATMRAQREELNAHIKGCQDALDALPVPKVRRAKKAATEHAKSVEG